MTRASRSTAAGLLRRHLASSRGPGLLLAVLVAVAVLTAAFLPRALAVLADAELRHELTSISVLRSDVTATGRVGYLTYDNDPGSIDDLYGPNSVAIKALANSQPPPLRDIMGEPSWFIEVSELDVELVDPAEPVRLILTPTIDLDFDSRITYLEGGAPAEWTGSTEDDALAADRPPMDIAITSGAAEELSLEIGDLLSSTYAPLRVAGIYEATDPTDTYWLHAPDLLRPATTSSLTGVKVVATSAYIDPMTAVGLAGDISFANFSVWYPTDPSTLTFDDVQPLLAQLAIASTDGLTLPFADRLTVQSGLTAALDGVIRRITATTALLALAGSAPLGVVFAALWLGVRSVIDRRRPALALASARGASGVQLRGVMLLEGSLISLPAAVLAVAVAMLVVPGAITPAGLVPAILVALVVPAMFAGTTSRRSLRPVRADLAVGSQRGYRWVIELVVVGLAALSLYLLSRRGLFTSSDAVGVDPLLAATPLLLSLALCVLVLRVYPLPLLALQRRTRRQRGAVGLVGNARAVRDPSTGFGSVLALVVGAAAAVFSLVMATTIGAAVVVGAQDEVGADIRVGAASFPSATIDSIDQLGGVAVVARVQEQGGVPISFGLDSVDITVVLADTAELHAIRPDLPELATGTGTVEFLASESVSARLGDDNTELAGTPATRVGTISDTALPNVDGQWVLVDSSAVAAVSDEIFAPRMLLIAVDPGADGASIANEVRELVGDKADVVDTASVLAAAASRPSTSGVTGALGIAAALSLALGLLTIVLGSIAGASARSAMVGILRVLGMSPRQITALVAWEFVPLAIAAVATGTALGLALPLVVTGVIDLRAFVGGYEPIDPVYPWPQVAVIAVGFAVAAVLTAVVTAAISRRRDPAATLRIGG